MLKNSQVFPKLKFSGNLFAFRSVRVLYLQSNSDIVQLAGSGLGFVPLLLSFSSAPLMLWFNSEVSEGLKLYYTDEREVRCLTYEGLCFSVVMMLVFKTPK